ncbi:MAG TPA: DUF402 domain-containing protein [Anaerolineales bacterium]|nr:DUF402 domain-containing protein [Anaerolineales bacterium]
MDTNRKWKTGETILTRCVWHRRLWFAMPVTVVQDTDNLIAVYWRANTPKKISANRITYKELLADEQISLVDSRWVRSDVLMLCRPSSAHGILVMWETGHVKFNCWYVNLQQPLYRTPLGFDTMDQLLDIVLMPDLSSWHWKDEDEFSDAVEHGVYSLTEAKAIREEGERVVKTLQEENSLFIQGWEKWRPSSEWQLPEMPSNWNDLSFHDEQS